MASPQWRSRLVEAMGRQGLPTAYVNRLIDELCDHAENILRENSGMDAEQIVIDRLGSPEQLAEVARCEFHRRTFAGRHPIVIFVAGPAFVMLGTFVVSVILVVASCWLIDTITGGRLSANDATNGPPSALEMGVMQTLNVVVRFVPFAASAWLYVRLGKRSGRRGWGVVACGLIAFTAICFFSTVNQQTAESTGAWYMGLGWKFGIDQILQAMAPLAFGAGMLWKMTKADRTIATA